MTEDKKAHIQNLALRGLIPMQAFERIERNECPFCGEEPDGFRDNISLREFAISGLCQRCQDLTFDDIFPED